MLILQRTGRKLENGTSSKLFFQCGMAVKHGPKLNNHLIPHHIPSSSLYENAYRTCRQRRSHWLCCSINWLFSPSPSICWVWFPIPCSLCYRVPQWKGYRWSTKAAIKTLILITPLSQVQWCCVLDAAASGPLTPPQSVPSSYLTVAPCYIYIRPSDYMSVTPNCQRTPPYIVSK